MAMIKKAFFSGLLVAISAMSSLASTGTNKWSGAVSDKYNVGGNWSLGHVPTSTEFVIFPDLDKDYIVDLEGGSYQTGTIHIDYRKQGRNTPVSITLKGGGSLTAQVTEDQYCFRSYRRLVLDGVTLTLNGSMTLFYDNATLQNGARLCSNKGFYSWGNGMVMSIATGCSVEFDGVYYYNVKGKIAVDGGSFACGGILPWNNSTACVDLSLDGGSILVNGNATFAASAKISVGSGQLTITGTLTAPDGVAYNLKGGSFAAVAAADSATESRIKTVASGTEIGFGSIFAKNNEVLRLTATLRNSGNNVLLPEGVTLISDFPVFAKSMQNGDITKTWPTLKLKTLIVDGPYPFTTTKGDAVDRYVNLVGPTELRAVADANQSSGSFVLISGDVTVNTDDYNNPTVGRQIYLRFGTKGDSNLTIKGCGSAVILNPTTYDGMFSKVTVDANAKLVLAEGQSRLDTRELVLKAGSTLELTVGKQLVRAMKWTIDPTARLVVNVPSGCSQTAWTVAADMMSGIVPFEAGQVTVQGAGATGWSTVVESGAVAIVKQAASIDGKYTYEWTGEGADSNFSTKENWYCKQNPTEYQVNAFGVATDKLNPYFDHVYNSDGNAGWSLGTIYFRETAVRTYTISGATSTTMTLGNNAASDAGTITKWGAYSDSALPQKIVGPKVRNGGHLALMGHREAPVVINSALMIGDKSTMYTAGDVRYGGSSNINSMDFRASPSLAGTRFTVLKNGQLKIKGLNVFACYSGSPSYLSFGVEENATLSFTCDNKTDAMYDWWTPAAAHVVDGVLDIQCQFGNRCDQLYDGKGTLKIANPKWTRTDISRTLTIGGTLTFVPPENWNTVLASVPDYGWRLVVRGTPTIKTTGNFTYGPETGSTPKASMADRACEVFYDATLTLNPSGNVATFKDPVVGNGTLAITNGTLRIDGDIASTLSIAVRKDAILALSAAKNFANADLAVGSVFCYTVGAPLTVLSDVDLNGVVIQTSDPEFETTIGWHPLVVANGAITGTPSIPNDWKTKLVTANGKTTLYGRVAKGLLLFIK